MKVFKVFNLKCESEDHIYNVSIEATNIVEAIELARVYIEEHNLEPIAIWEV